MVDSSANAAVPADAPVRVAVADDDRTPPIAARRPDPWLRAAAIVVIAAALSFARGLLLPLVIAVLLALLLAPAVAALHRLRIPEALGAAIVLAMVATALAAVGAHLYAPAQRWLSMSDADLRRIEAKLEALKRPVAVVKDVAEKVTGITEAPGETPPREVVIERKPLAGVVTLTQGFALSAGSMLILLYFLLASGDLFLRKLVRVLPSLADKKRAVEMSRMVRKEIGRYFAAVTMINVGLGVVTAAAMAWLGMPNPALWGVMVAVLNFVPYLGPLTSLALLAFAALVTFDAWPAILAVPATFAVLTFIEGQVVQPIVIGRHVAINPVVIFVAVLAWGWLWGIGGVLIAVPLLVAVKILAEHVAGAEAIAEFLGDG